MIQGIRITSNNLSGLTANVTFLPTTGGTIDLGSEVIPFDNISVYPYGTYELDVPLYDRMYEINVPAPLTGQSAYTQTVRTVTVDGGYQPFSGAVLSVILSALPLLNILPERPSSVTPMCGVLVTNKVPPSVVAT